MIKSTAEFTLNVYNYCQNKKGLTIASLPAAESLATGLFCFDKLPTFIAGPETLRREGSLADQPVVLPSSPPGQKLQTTILFPLY